MSQQKRVLVAGVNGFVGKHLTAELFSQGHEVVGLGHENVVSGEISQQLTNYEMCDLADASKVAKIALEDIDAVINLAGLANVGASRDNPKLYHQVNLAVHTNLYDELIRRNLRPRVVAISTGAVYDPNQQMPQNEEGLMVEDAQTSPYVVSKKRMEAELASRRKDLDIIIARPFNHTGPGQRPGFLIPDLAEELLLSDENDGVLRAGNLKTKRDYTDVRDVVIAYTLLALAETLQFDTYNVCSGVSRSGLEVLEQLKSAFHKDNLRVEIDPTRIRPNDVMDIYGSAERIQTELGWMPQISIEQTIQDFVKWRLSKLN